MFPEGDNMWVPEPICGGGFRLMKRKGVFEYKSIRLGQEMWPWIGSDVVSAWDGSTEIVIEATQKCFPANTTLKAFNGAPAWTLSELNIFKDVMSKHGVTMKKMPFARTLLS
jgi:hypothetical protein